jgi:hypothetical protein
VENQHPVLPRPITTPVAVAAGSVRQAERLDAMGEVAAEPVGDARRKRGDDDLVEPTALNRYRAREQWRVSAGALCRRYYAFSVGSAECSAPAAGV